MDVVSSCKDKLAYFRIKELKDVLTHLGVPKQGKKQDLTDRILALLSDDQASKVHGWPKKSSIGKEGIVKIIEDTYRKMQSPGAYDLPSMGQTDSDANNLKPKEEVDDFLQLEMKVRCLCRKSLPTESMIQCEDPRCHVWQHIDCVIISEKPTDGVPPVPSQFYCEMCRIKWADPFWVTLDHPLPPVKLTASSLPTDGTNPVQSVEKHFNLTRAHRDLLQKTEYDVQVWCMLLNDKVTFRMQWPQFSDLQVNGVPVRTVNRPGTQMLGANGRDDGPVITTCTREGTNKIFLSGCDARIFCVGVRIARRRTVQHVLSMIPKESEGEPFDDALARVCRCIGGGNADSDSDFEVASESVPFNLRCPMSGSRMKIAGRFKPCAHMGCFDLETFVELNQRSRKWQCPICLKSYSLDYVIIDPYFNRITTLMLDCGEDVNEIDVKPDGSWRAKNEDEHKDLAQWHSPSGSLYVAVNGEVQPDLENAKIKQEVLSEGHPGLKLGIKKNRNGIWEVSKPEAEGMQAQSLENLPVKFESPKVIPMSSTATGSCRDGEDPSVNQDGGGHFDFSANNGNEMDTISLNFDPTCTVASRVPSAPSGVADVIVLSDSEEERENLTGTISEFRQANTGGVPFSVPPFGIPDSYPDDPYLVTGSSCLGLFNGNCDDFGMPLWPMPSGTQAGPGFQLFETETNVSDSFIDVEHTSIPTSLNGYTLAPEIAMGPVTQLPDSNNDLNSGLVDNPLAFDADDPSLQIFLPPHPADSSVQADLRDQPDTSNGTRADDWISLRLGGGGGGCGSSIGHGESGTTNGLSSRHEVASKEGRESLANTASLLLGMNSDRPDGTRTKRQIFHSLFSHPRQQRSVRSRYLSIDSDSD